jgi:hypothetical protein
MIGRTVAGLCLTGAAVAAAANAPNVIVGQTYQCPNGRSFKILGCSPDGSTCDIQAYNEQGQPVVRGMNTLAQLQGAVASCPARSAAAHPAAAPAAASAPAAPAPPRAAAAAPAARAAGGPPKPGLASCAGKFEGRYASQAGAGGLLTITFRSGKATVRQPDMVMKDGKLASMSSEREADCWYGGGKIYLRWLNGDTDDFPIDVNDDGTLDTAYGELKKKGGLQAFPGAAALKASRVRFSQPPAVTARLSSMRMPPNFCRAATRGQLMRRLCASSARAASSSCGMK